MKIDEQKASYMDWDRFIGEDIPSSLNTYPLLYERIDKTKSVVDIGCGFGKTCFELLANGFSSITGYDINQSGIEFANNKLRELAKYLRDRCVFEIKDALDTGYDDNRFDAGIMQAFLTTLTTPEIRHKALTEARRIINNTGWLYLAVFMQTWHSEKYLKRYETGEYETGETGSFNAYDKATLEFQYQAHHYSERELVYLLKNSGFKIDSFEYHVFKTRNGNSVNGAVILAA